MSTFRYRKKLQKHWYLLLLSAGLLTPFALYFIVPGINGYTAAVYGVPGALLALISTGTLMRSVLFLRETVWFLELPVAFVRYGSIREIGMMRGEIGVSIRTDAGKTLLHSVGKRPMAEDIGVLRQAMEKIVVQAGKANPSLMVSEQARQFLDPSSEYYKQRLDEARMERDELKGLGGWLSALAAYLIIASAIQLLNVALGNPLPQVSAENNRVLYILDIVITITNLGLAGLALFSFFRRKKAFQRNVLIYYGTYAASLILTALVRDFVQAGGLTMDTGIEFVAGLVIQASRFLALRGYMKLSLRVRNTFLRS